MNAPWIRVPPGRRETVGAAFVAGVLAVGVGAVAFYVTRLVLARERLSEGGAHTPRARTDSAGDGEA